MGKNAEVFEKVYAQKLEEVVRKYPGEYGWAAENAPVVAHKMMDAFKKHNANKDGRAIKATCKELGIAYTYAGIYAFLEKE